jgi:CheY-like chemotaxis protein
MYHSTGSLPLWPICFPSWMRSAEGEMTSDKVNILLVDDQPAKLLSYEVILGELGENLVKVSSGLEALEHLLKNEVAVVLTDVCMPELDGYQLAAMIRELTLDLASLPKLDASIFTGSPATPVATAANAQDLTTWQAEAAAIAAGERRITGGSRAGTNRRSAKLSPSSRCSPAPTPWPTNNPTSTTGKLKQRGATGSAKRASPSQAYPLTRLASRPLSLTPLARKDGRLRGGAMSRRLLK